MCATHWSTDLSFVILSLPIQVGDVGPLVARFGPLAIRLSIVNQAVHRDFCAKDFIAI